MIIVLKEEDQAAEGWQLPGLIRRSREVAYGANAHLCADVYRNNPGLCDACQE